MGRTPPSFFLAACRRPEAGEGATVGGTAPASILLTSLVRAARAGALLVVELEVMAARRWSGRSPEGPGAVPRGNLVMAFSTSSWGMVRGAWSVVGGAPMGRAGSGGFSRSTLRVAAEWSAMPELVRAWMALVIWPSPALMRARSAFLLTLSCSSVSSVMFPRLRPLLTWGLVALAASAHSTAASPACHLRNRSLTATFRAWLALRLGALAGRMQRGEMRTLIQASSLASSAAVFHRSVSSLAKSPLQDLGGHLWVAMEVVNCSSREGREGGASGSGPPGVACGPPGGMPRLPAGEGEGADVTSLPLAGTLDRGVQGEDCTCTLAPSSPEGL